MTEDRFWSRILLVENCWEWLGYRMRLGYGQLHHGGRTAYAHVVAYELFKGPVPDGLEIDHLCRNPGCVNPNHLEAVTHRENMLRGRTPSAAHAAKTHCHRGHPLSGENLQGLSGRRERICKECRRLRRLKYRAKRLAQLHPITSITEVR
jgi:hypothetical protein